MANTHLPQPLAGLHDFLSQRGLALQVVFAEYSWVLVKFTALRHDLHPQLRLSNSADLHKKYVCVSLCMCVCVCVQALMCVYACAGKRSDW